MQTRTACVTKTKCSVAPTNWPATTTLLQQTTMVLVPKTTPLAYVVVLVRPTQMRTAFVTTWTHAWVTWTLVACATVTTLLVPVVRTLLLATTKEPPLTMALVCIPTNVACAVALALQMVHAIAMATSSMSAACVAVKALQTAHATALETPLTLVACAVVQVWMRMPTAFATTSTTAWVSTTNAVCATETAALAPTHVQLQPSLLLTR